jgi:hypothetical protein
MHNHPVCTQTVRTVTHKRVAELPTRNIHSHIYLEEENAAKVASHTKTSANFVSIAFVASIHLKVHTLGDAFPGNHSQESVLDVFVIMTAQFSSISLETNSMTVCGSGKRNGTR